MIKQVVIVSILPLNSPIFPSAESNLSTLAAVVRLGVRWWRIKIRASVWGQRWALTRGRLVPNGTRAGGVLSEESKRAPWSSPRFNRRLSRDNHTQPGDVHSGKRDCSLSQESKFIKFWSRFMFLIYPGRVDESTIRQLSEGKLEEILCSNL